MKRTLIIGFQDMSGVGRPLCNSIVRLSYLCAARCNAVQHGIVWEHIGVYSFETSSIGVDCFLGFDEMANLSVTFFLYKD